MTHYLSQLHADLQSRIFTRWRHCPPHYWVMGMPDPYLILPKELEGMERPDPDSMASALPAWMFDSAEDDTMSPATAASLEEVERYVEEVPAITMFDHFDLRPEGFPPAERLADAQLADLVTALRRLWATFNFTAVLPDGLPARLAYPVLLTRMAEPAMLMAFGHIGIEFCHYEPTECPWGPEWCDCKNF